VVVHPIRADTELATGLHDTDPESLLGIRKSESAILGHEGTVDVDDVLSVLAVGEQGVENCDGSAVYEEADLAPEGAIQPVGEIGVRLREELARLRNVIYAFHSQNNGGGRCMCYWRCQMLHRHGHMHDGHDETRKCCCWTGSNEFDCSKWC
jgi:hypothetical protein